MSRRPLSSRNSDVLPRHGGKGKKKDRGHFCLDRATLMTDLNSILVEVTAYGSLVIKEGDLKTPTLEVIQLVYLKLLDFCFEVTLEALKQAWQGSKFCVPHWISLATGMLRSYEAAKASFQEEGMECSELMEDFTFRIQFFRIMKRFMKACLINDFKLEEIFNPESYRTCQCLSALDNFIKFHVNVYHYDDEMESTRQTSDMLCKETRELQGINSKLMKEMAELEQKRDQEHGFKEELKEKIASRGQVMQEMKYREEYLLGQYKSVGDAMKFSEQKLVDLNKEFEKNPLRVEELMKKVVTSPDKLKYNLARLRHKYSEAVASSKDSEALLRMWESLTSHAHQTPRVVMESLKENFDNIISVVENIKSLELDYETMEEQTQKLSRQLRETTLKHQRLLQFLKQQVEETDRLACRNITASHTRATDDLQREIVLLKQEDRERQQKDERFVAMTYIEQRSVAAHKDTTNAALTEIDEVTRELLKVQQETMIEYGELTSHLGMDRL